LLNLLKNEDSFDQDTPILAVIELPAGPMPMVMPFDSNLSFFTLERRSFALSYNSEEIPVSARG
jgi:hypothetical protein